MNRVCRESIRAQGRYPGVSLAGVAPELAMALYRFMLRLRRCEESLIAEYHPADQMRCPVHFCLGQESVAAALSLVIRPEDYLFCHHRTHNWYFAKGAPMKALFAEMYGRATGANGGLSGSQEISYPALNFYGGAILTGSVGIATGAARSQQLLGTDHVAVAGFGEGATDEGVFWEAMNYAALRRLPVVYLCENNGYATWSPQHKRQPQDNISQKAAAFGVQTYTIFGNDAILAHQTVSQAVAGARAGQPALVEAYTYRWNGHVGPENDDVQNYRPLEELAFWKDNDPIALLEEAMTNARLLDAARKQALEQEIAAEIAEAFAFAKQSPWPLPADWRALNYSQETPRADELLSDVESGQFDQHQDEAIPGPY